MSRKSPKPPPEDPEVRMQRERSILDLARLDEDENKRIKQLRSASRGVRAFRAMRSGSGAGKTAPSLMGGGGGSSGDPSGGFDAAGAGALGYY